MPQSDFVPKATIGEKLAMGHRTWGQSLGYIRTAFDAQTPEPHTDRLRDDDHQIADGNVLEFERSP